MSTQNWKRELQKYCILGNQDFCSDVSPKDIEDFIESLLSLHNEELVKKLEKLLDIQNSEAKGYEILEDSDLQCCPGDDCFLGYETGIKDAITEVKRHE